MIRPVALLVTCLAWTLALADPSLAYLRVFSSVDADTPWSAPSPAPDSEQSVVAEQAFAAPGTSNGWTNFNLLKGLQFPFMLGNKAQPNSIQEQLDEETHCMEGSEPGSFSVDISQYEDEAVFRFAINSDKERAKFCEASETLMLDIWELGNDYANVRINRRRFGSFLKLLPKIMRKNYEEVVGDMQRAVFSSYPLKSRASSRSLNFDTNLACLFEEYRDLKTIQEWLQALVKRYDFITKETLGSTYQDRPLEAIKLGASDKPEITLLITGGFQGRDWVSIFSALYVMHSLAEEYAVTGTGLLSRATVYVIPVANPDGYVYTWEADRLWRKNRQPTGVSLCVGIDIEHSFSEHRRDQANWRPQVPCSENYGGYKAFESLEAAAIHDMIVRHNISAPNYLQFSSRLAPKHYAGPSALAMTDMRLIALERVQQTPMNLTLVEQLGRAALLVNPTSASKQLGVLSAKRALANGYSAAIGSVREWSQSLLG